MSIENSGHLVRLAHREGMEAAAKIVDRESNRVMRQANQYHDQEDPDYDMYEDLECKAAHLGDIAAMIRRRAKRAR